MLMICSLLPPPGNNMKQTRLLFCTTLWQMDTMPGCRNCSMCNKWLSWVISSENTSQASLTYKDLSLKSKCSSWECVLTAVSTLKRRSLHTERRLSPPQSLSGHQRPRKRFSARNLLCGHLQPPTVVTYQFSYLNHCWSVWSRMIKRGEM